MLFQHLLWSICNLAESASVISLELITSSILRSELSTSGPRGNTTSAELLEFLLEIDDYAETQKRLACKG